MAEEQRYKIPLFDGNNYDNWKFRIETYLDELELLEFIQNPLDDMFRKVDSTEQPGVQKEREKSLLQKRDKKCKSAIIRRIADNQLEYVKDSKTAHDIWQTLANTFARKGIASQLLIRKMLLTMKFNSSNDTLEAHFLRFNKLIRDLKSTGATLEETDIVCHLLLTMPAEYDVVVTAIETLSEKNLKLSFVKNRLLDEQAKRLGVRQDGEVSTSTAFTAPLQRHKGTSSKYKPNQFKKNADRKQYQCHHCGGFGHFRKDCRKPPRVRHKFQKEVHVAANVDEEVDACTFFADADRAETLHWYLDSGASEHLVNSDKIMSNVRDLDHNILIKSAKTGSMLTGTKRGDVCIQSVVDGKTHKIVIQNVLFVPGLQFNLISVSVLEKNGYVITFRQGRGIIQKNDKILAIANRRHKLYELVFTLAAETANLCEMEKGTELWHRRMGHIGMKSLQKLKLLVTGVDATCLDNDRQICPICVQGKQTKLPHQQTRQRAKRPLQLVHSDLFGPINPQSHSGKRYVLTFIDDFTHFTVAYLLKSKADVFQNFKLYEAMATTHFNLKISRFRCDNGREYLSTEMKTHFEERGIQFECTIRHTPQQNGVAERMNRTILEKARCMLLDSTLPKYLWSEAVLAAVYLINRCATSTLEKAVPAELWYGERVDLKKVKVFGCKAYLHLPKPLVQGKFSTRSKECYMIGYCSNGYRLWSPEDGKVLYGRDIIFDERPLKTSQRTEDIYEDVETAHDSNDKQDAEIQVHQDPEKARTEGDILREEKESPNQELRRSSRTKTVPKHFQDYVILALNADTFVEDLPTSFEQDRITSATEVSNERPGNSSDVSRHKNTEDRRRNDAKPTNVPAKPSRTVWNGKMQRSTHSDGDETTNRRRWRVYHRDQTLSPNDWMSNVRDADDETGH